MIDQIKNYIASNASNKLSSFNSKLIKTNSPIYGVRTPLLRDIAKKIASGVYKLFLEECDNSSYEITLIEGFVIGYAKMSLDEKFYYMDRFIPKIDNCVVHDGFVSSLKFTKKNPTDMYEYLMKYVNSKKEFEIRFVAIMLMSYYINDKYIDNDLDIISRLDIHTYYAKMGVAWFLSRAASKYKNKVFEYLLKEKDKQLISMTIRKIRDSYLIDQEFKDQIMQLKK